MIKIYSIDRKNLLIIKDDKRYFYVWLTQSSKTSGCTGVKKKKEEVICIDEFEICENNYLVSKNFAKKGENGQNLKQEYPWRIEQEANFLLKVAIEEKQMIKAETFLTHQNTKLRELIARLVSKELEKGKKSQKEKTSG